ncbi:MAG: hypothetical protein AB1898_32845 [Acidobacteriota bacterium]
MVRKLSIHLFLIVSTVYVLTTSGAVPYVTLDGMVRLEVVQKIVSEFRLDVPSRFGAGFAVRGADGRYYDPHEPGYAVCSVPFFVIGRWLGDPKFFLSLIGPIALSLACVVYLRLCLLTGYCVKTAAILSLLLAFCTQFWPESKSPFDHGLETLFSLSSVYWAYRYCCGRRPRDLMFSGAFLGLATTIKVVALLMSAPIGLMLIISSSPKGSERSLKSTACDLPWFALGAAPFLLIDLWTNFARFGSPFSTGYSKWAEYHQVSLFSFPLWKGLLGLLVSPGKGLLVYCPLVLAGLLCFRDFFRWRKELAIAVACAIVLYLSLFGTYIAWHGDFAWGPRYLTFLLPYLILPLGVWMDALVANSRRNQRVLFWGLAASSFAIQWSAVSIDMNVHFLRLQTAGILSRDVTWRTYALPDSLNFDPANSPLIWRFFELRDAFVQPKIFSGPKDEQRWKQVFTTPQREPELDFWWYEGMTDTPHSQWLLVLAFMGAITLSSVELSVLLRTESPVSGRNEHEDNAG